MNKRVYTALRKIAADPNAPFGYHSAAFPDAFSNGSFRTARDRNRLRRLPNTHPYANRKQNPSIYHTDYFQQLLSREGGSSPYARPLLFENQTSVKNGANFNPVTTKDLDKVNRRQQELFFKANPKLGKGKLASFLRSVIFPRATMRNRAGAQGQLPADKVQEMHKQDLEQLRQKHADELDHIDLKQVKDVMSVLAQNNAGVDTGKA